MMRSVWACGAVRASIQSQYRRRTGFTAPEFVEVMALLQAFYGPLLEDRTDGRWQDGQWN